MLILLSYRAAVEFIFISSSNFHFRAIPKNNPIKLFIHSLSILSQFPSLSLSFFFFFLASFLASTSSLLLLVLILGIFHCDFLPLRFSSSYTTLIISFLRDNLLLFPQKPKKKVDIPGFFQSESRSVCISKSNSVYLSRHLGGWTQVQGHLVDLCPCCYEIALFKELLCPFP